MIHGITQVRLLVSDSDGEYTHLKAAGTIFHSEPQTAVVA